MALAYQLASVASWTSTGLALAARYRIVLARKVPLVEAPLDDRFSVSVDWNF